MEYKPLRIGQVNIVFMGGAGGNFLSNIVGEIMLEGSKFVQQTHPTYSESNKLGEHFNRYFPLVTTYHAREFFALQGGGYRFSHSRYSEVVDWLKTSKTIIIDTGEYHDFCYALVTYKNGENPEYKVPEELNVKDQKHLRHFINKLQGSNFLRLPYHDLFVDTKYDLVVKLVKFVSFKSSRNEATINEAYKRLLPYYADNRGRINV